MTTKEIVQALRCTSTPGDLYEDCTGCPYYRKEQLDAELKEKLGVDTWPSCDVNKVGMGAASATGDRGAASATGKAGVALAAGYECKAMGALGCAICCVERGEWDGNTYPIIAVKAAIVDGETIKPDTWYRLENGEFVEVE